MINKSKIGFISLGCPKNQIDTEIMLKILAEDGYEIVAEDIHAGIIIINTCAFIESAKREAIDNILDVAWLKTNGAKKLKGIIVCGCLAERYREEILKEMPEVDALVGVFSIHDISEAVRHIEAAIGRPRENGGKFVSLKPQDGFKLGGERILTTPEYTAYIKISEGCDNNCSYCVIPLIRGGHKSRALDDIVKEAAELAEIGVKELCVVAQDTTGYGADLYGEYKLPELLNKLCEVNGIEWIRLLYCYPDKITDELIKTIKSQEKILKYIDMPVQHVNDGILKSMNRPGGSAAIKSAIEKLRGNIPGITIRTTVITGFPGETKEIFGELCEFIKETKFERLGAFAYSAEEGAPAAGFENQVSEKEKERRRKIIMAAQERVNYKLNQNQTGRTIKVLCEGYDPAGGVFYGRSESDAPEIDGKVYFISPQSPAVSDSDGAPFQNFQNFQKGAKIKGAKINEGDFVYVKIERVVDYDLFGCLQ
jgi:ribosomal protein S12 methylthiotransferase